MKKIFKILLYTIGVLVFALALLLGYLVLNRDKIHDEILISMRETMQAKVEFDKVDFTVVRNFPSVSIELKNVLIADSLYELYHVPLIKSKSLFLETSFWSLITLNLNVKKIILQDAALNIFKTHTEYSNDYVLNNLSKKKEKPAVVEPKEKSKAEFNIEKVGLYNVGISIHDSLNKKHFGFNFKDVNCSLNKLVNETNIVLTGDIFMEGLTFKERKGTFIKNQPLYLDAHLHIGENEGLIEIQPSTLNIGKAHFDLKGHINTVGKGELKLMLHNDAVTLEDTKNILTQKIYKKLSQFSFGGSMNTDVTIQTPLKGVDGDPYVTVKAMAKGIPINIMGNEIEDARFHGTFINYIDTLSEPGDENSTITFPDFSAVANGIPIKGVVKVISFDDARLELDLTGHGELKKLQNFMNENEVVIKGGTLDFNIGFMAHVENLYDTLHDKMNGSLRGNLTIKNATMLSVPKKLTLSNINTSIDMGEKGFFIRHLHVNAPGSDLNVIAHIEKPILFLFSDRSKLLFNCQLASDKLNLEPMFSNEAVAKVKPAKKKKKIEQTVSSAIDRILKQADIDISFKVKHVYAWRFNAYNGTGRIRINDNKASLTEFAFSHAHGKMKYNAQLLKKGRGYHANFTANAKDVSMPEFMEAFENFGQKSLTKKNLKGTVNLNINASCGLSSGFKVVPKSMRGDLRLNVENGELNNFEPMVSLSKYALKGRKLDSIKFTNLSCNANLRGNEIYLHKLYVLSSAISIAADGIYSFGDSTDLSIQIPLKNLKSSAPEYFTSVEKFEQYNGANVYIRGRTKDKKLSFSYDPLKKMRKKKK